MARIPEIRRTNLKLRTGAILSDRRDICAKVLMLRMLDLPVFGQFATVVANVAWLNVTKWNLKCRSRAAAITNNLQRIH